MKNTITQILLPDSSHVLRNWFDRSILDKFEQAALWFYRTDEDILYQHISPEGIRVYSKNKPDAFMMISKASLMMKRVLTGSQSSTFIAPLDYAEHIMVCTYSTFLGAFELKNSSADKRQTELIPNDTKLRDVPDEFRYGYFVVGDKTAKDLGELAVCLNYY